jgi:hypothetical protein
MRSVLEESGYNERRNRYGEICWVIGITGAGAEGISLKCCRSVHIMEPYWNNVRLDQVKGRAIRICSHQDLPFKDREVEIYTYYTVFSVDQANKSKIDMTLQTNDSSKTSDQFVYDISLKKDKVNNEILNIMKESAVDCGLNSADNGDVTCFVVDGKPDQYIFDPDLEYDKILTSIELREVERLKEDATDAEKAIARELGEAPPATMGVIKDRFTVIKWKSVEYFASPKEGSGGLVFNLYLLVDKERRKPIGEIATNPATGTFKGSTPTFT